MRAAPPAILARAGASSPFWQPEAPPEFQYGASRCAPRRRTSRRSQHLFDVGLRAQGLQPLSLHLIQPVLHQDVLNLAVDLRQSGLFRIALTHFGQKLFSEIVLDGV